MSYEEVIEVGDNYYLMAQFRYLLTFKVEYRNGLRLLAEAAITTKDKAAGARSRESRRYPASEWVLSKRDSFVMEVVSLSMVNTCAQRAHQAADSRFHIKVAKFREWYLRRLHCDAMLLEWPLNLSELDEEGKKLYDLGRTFFPGKGEEAIYNQVSCLVKWKKDRGIVTVQDIAKSISGDVAENLEVVPVEVEKSSLKRKRHEEKGSSRTKPHASAKMAELELKYYSMAATNLEQLDAEYYEHTFVLSILLKGAKKCLEKKSQEFEALIARFEVQSARLKEFEDQSAHVKKLKDELKLEKEQKELKRLKRLQSSQQNT
ncbi:hypothetical protein GIB67_031781 [Kingdonia uniflora]|uniref:Uncharacterized protein n=1 Tax=Kingdonia uniflora TaxID=39325 RepID=A0A7J7L4K6_9MAGN|nr:hypothetical protein GIB67_031781 [Kingdonia uniflora]